eukprot:385119-Rhodomonas_salina.1
MRCTSRSSSAVSTARAQLPPSSVLRCRMGAAVLLTSACSAARSCPSRLATHLLKLHRSFSSPPARVSSTTCPREPGQYRHLATPDPSSGSALGAQARGQRAAVTARSS